MAESKKKPPKTPSAGQFRAIAQMLHLSVRGTQDEPLLVEAATDVAAWLEHQSQLRSRPS